MNLVRAQSGAGAEDALLQEDAVAGLAPPLPDALDELLAPEVVARVLPSRASMRSTTSLGGDAGVVGARLPERVVPAHAVPADEHVLERAR